MTAQSRPTKRHPQSRGAARQTTAATGTLPNKDHRKSLAYDLPKVLQPMISLNHWVIWKRLKDERKVPFCAGNPREPASVSNPKTWSTYDAALKVAPVQGGIGFVLKGSGIGALDLDDCFDVETGHMDEWARDLVDKAAGTYVEVTPSGRGLRIIGCVTGAPVHVTIKMPTGKVEVYRDAPRFITVTGDFLTRGKSLINIDNLIDATAAQRNPKDASTSGLFFREVTALLDKGWSVDRIVSCIRQKPARFSKTKAAQYDQEGRLEAEVERIVAKRLPTEGNAGWRIESNQRFVEGFVPPDYLIDGVLQRRFIYSLTGKTGSGKSAVTLMLAALVGHKGASLGERNLKRGRVLYFAGENPDDIRMRWLAMRELDPALADTDVYFLHGSMNLSRDIEKIAERVRELGGVQFIVVDTARSFYEGDDENNNVQMGDYARMLRTLTKLPGEPCVIVNCHPPKNASQDNLQPVGGGAFIAEMDGNLSCQRSGPSVVSIHWQGKFRGPEFEPLFFELIEMTAPGLVDSDKRPIKSVAAMPAKKPVNGRSVHELSTPAQVIALLRRQPDLSLAQIAKELGWLQNNKEPSKTKAQRAIKVLIEEGKVKRVSGRLVLI